MPVETQVARFTAMGTRVELHLFGAGDAAALAGARRAVEAVDDALTIHRPSPATAMNDALAAGGEAAIDDPLLMEALVAVAAQRDATAGLFDPTASLGAASAWPHIDPAAGRVRAATPAAFDFGGFGKGHALDRAAAVLRSAGIASAFLSAGESSILAIGAHPLGGAWPVAVPHPLLPGRWLAELELEDEALSVSATVGGAPGRRDSIRPANGTAVTAPATAIAVEASGAAAEAMSTALLVADDAGAARLVAGHPHHRYRFVHADDQAMRVTA